MKKHISIQAPASKSLSHRALIAASLAKGVSTVDNVLQSEDLEKTRAILESVGAGITRTGSHSFKVTGTNGVITGGADKTTAVACDVHESGTTCRLLVGLLASGKGTFYFHGAPRMYERPMQTLLSVLTEQGVTVECTQKDGYLPLYITTQGLRGKELSISVNDSSQYLSGVLLAACQTDGMEILVTGDKVVSWPYVALTLQILHDFSLSEIAPFTVYERETPQSEWIKKEWRSIEQVRPNCLKIAVQGKSANNSQLRAQKYFVEGDWSNSSYFLAAGAIGAPVVLQGIKQDSLQGDAAIVPILEKMGAKIQWRTTEKGSELEISAPENGLQGITVDMSSCPDLVPTVACVAAFANGVTTITNVAHLRIKECDRLDAPAAELTKAGIKVQTTEDSMIITGSITPQIITENRKEIALSAYNDHRIAMSLSLLNFADFKPVFDKPECVNKSFPTFWQEWDTIIQGNMG